ncbi:hypothetical protein H4W00_002322 [Psychrobacter sp. PL19]
MAMLLITADYPANIWFVRNFIHGLVRNLICS